MVRAGWLCWRCHLEEGRSTGRAEAAQQAPGPPVPGNGFFDVPGPAGLQRWALSSAAGRAWDRERRPRQEEQHEGGAMTACAIRSNFFAAMQHAGSHHRAMESCNGRSAPPSRAQRRTLAALDAAPTSKVARQLRAGAQRHAVPRRDRGAPARAAGEVPPRPGGAEVPPPRWPLRGGGRRPGSSAPRTAISRRRSARAASARTSTSGSTSSRSFSLSSRSGARTSRSSPTTSSRSSTVRPASTSRACPPARSGSCRATPGPGTSVSCATPSSAR